MVISELDKLGQILFVNTSIQIIGKAVSIITGFLTVYLLTHYLGVDKYGDYILVFSYLAVFSSLGDLGLHLTTVKEFAQRKTDNKTLFGSYVLLRSILIFISFVLSLGFLLITPYPIEVKCAIIVASIGVSIGSFSSIANSIFQSKLRIDIITIVDIVAKIISLLLICLFVILRISFVNIFFFLLISNSVSLFLSIYFLIKRGELSMCISSITCFRLLKMSIPVGIISVIYLLYFKIDNLMLSVMKPPSELGYYGLSYKIFENILIFWGYYMVTLYPVLSYNATKLNSNKFELFINKHTRNILMYSIVLIIASYIFAPTMINIIAGRNYAPSIISFRILIFSIPFFFINNLYYHIAIAKNYSWKLLQIIISALFLNIILNYIFIPKYSFIAASLITVLTEMITYIGYKILYQSYHEK